MENFIFESPREGDRTERTGGGLPPFKVLNYKSGKTGELHAKATTPEQVKAFFTNGDIGFTFYDKEIGIIPVQEGTFALLGLFWKLNTYTAGDKSADRFSSNMVMDIKNGTMKLFKNGEPTKYEGTYKSLKEQNIWGKETKITMYWVVMEVSTERLFAMPLTSTVKNGIKRSVLKAYSKPITAQGIEREGLYGLFDSPDNFHAFTLLGANIANGKGMPYRGDKGEGDGYCMPHFQCVIIRREKAPELADKLLATRKAFFGSLIDRQNVEPAVAKEKPTSVLEEIEWPDTTENPLPGAGVAQAIVKAKRDPFTEEDDLPF